MNILGQQVESLTIEGYLNSDYIRVLFSTELLIIFNMSSRRTTVKQNLDYYNHQLKYY